MEGVFPLIDSLITKVTSAPRGFPSYNRTKSSSSNYFIEEFRQGFNSYWMQNKNIVIGSDSFYQILSSNEWKLEKFVSEFVGLLPWNDERYSLPGSDDCSTAIILHRSSRMDHALTAWSLSSPKISFTEWILSDEGFNQLDQFSIAETFYENGIGVDIVDINHVSTLDQSLSHFIACQILKLECDDSGNLAAEVGSNTKVNKVAVQPISQSDISRGKLSKLNEILGEYECCFEFTNNARFLPPTSSFYRNLLINCKCSIPGNLHERRNVTRARIGELLN